MKSGIKPKIIFALTLIFIQNLHFVSPSHSVVSPTILIDPGNSSSYLGSGTTVTSIGSNTQSGTLSNITYSSNFGGIFTFNGSSSQILFNTWDFTSTFSVIAWVKPNASTSNINTLFGNCGANVTTNGFKAMWNDWNTTNRKMTFQAGNGTTGSSVGTDSAAVTFSEWQQVAYVINKTSGTYAAYVNGVQQTVTTNSIITNFATSAAWRIGSMGGSYLMKGDLGLFKVYTSILNQSDISTEYNATRSRYASPMVPTVTAQPSDSTVDSGTAVTFTGAGSVTDGGTLSYNWQVSTDNGSNYTTATSGTGITSNSYTTATSSRSMNGYKFRLTITNSLNGVTSAVNTNVATLAVNKLTPTVTLSLSTTSVTQVTYRQTVSITISASTPGKVSLKAGKVWIPGCRSISISTTRVCSFKPSVRGSQDIIATLIPTQSSDYFNASSPNSRIMAVNRTTPR